MREVDIVISMDRPESGDVRIRKLFTSRLRIYATGDYFAGRPAPQSVADLKDALEKAGVEFDSRAHKADLQKLAKEHGV